MKTPRDPRHLKRIKAMQELFVWNFQKSEKPKSELALKISEDIVEIDQEIQKAAPTRPLDQINHLDLAVLRLAVFELIKDKKMPFKVVVDEAVELAKEFDGESSPGFVNGVLGNIITQHHINESIG